MVELIISFPSSIPGKHSEVWRKLVKFSRVPVVGEVIWVESMEDYVVTNVMWDAENGSACVLCQESEPVADEDWIANLESSGFVKSLDRLRS